MKKLLASLLSCSCLVGTLSAQTIAPGGGGGGGGGGSGTVSSVGGGCGATASPSPVTSTGNIFANYATLPISGASYTVGTNSECGGLTVLTNSSAVAVSLPQAGTGIFTAGWFEDYHPTGAGGAVITPTTSTINGAANITLPQNSGVRVTSDGTNYQISQLPSSGAGTVTTVICGGVTIAGSGTCGSGSHPGYVANNWYLPLEVFPSGSAGTVGTANLIVCYYGAVPRKVTVEALGVQMSTVGSGGNVQLALYENSGGVPGALINNTANISTTTGTTISGALGANKQVGPGGADGDDNIWWCSNRDNATVIFNSVSVASIPTMAWNWGSSTLSNITAGATTIGAISCSGAACNGGSSTFNTWPSSLVGSTWSTVTTRSAPLMAFEVLSYP